MASWKSMTKIAGSGSISQRHGSSDPDPDPDPHQNVMDPQHCWQGEGMLTTAVVNRSGCHWTSIKCVLTEARDLRKETITWRNKLPWPPGSNRNTCFEWSGCSMWKKIPPPLSYYRAGKPGVLPYSAVFFVPESPVFRPNFRIRFPDFRMNGSKHLNPALVVWCR